MSSGSRRRKALSLISPHSTAWSFRTNPRKAWGCAFPDVSARTSRRASPPGCPSFLPPLPKEQSPRNRSLTQHWSLGLSKIFRSQYIDMIQKNPLDRRLLRIEHRGRTIAAADSLHEILEAFRLFRPQSFLVCDVFLDSHCNGVDSSRIWGRLIGHPNGLLSVEPTPRWVHSAAVQRFSD